MASKRQSDGFTSKQLMTFKKDQLVNIILESQKANSPRLSAGSKKAKMQVSGRESEDLCVGGTKTTQCELSSEEIKAQIKAAVEDAVQEFKSEVRKEHEANLKDIEMKFKNEISSLQNEVSALKKQLDVSIKGVEKELLHDMRETEERKDNIMLFGLMESGASAPSASKEDDLSAINFLASQLGVNLEISNFFRLGRRSSKPRPLKITCKEKHQRTCLLRAAFKIPQLDAALGFRRVFIKPDLSPKEQEADRQLRQEFFRRREAGEHVTIRRGCIIDAVNHFQSR